MEAVIRHSTRQFSPGPKVRRNPVDSFSCRCSIHLHKHDLRLEVIQVEADGICKLGVTDFLLHGNNVAAALDHVLNESQVTWVVRIGPHESLEFYVFECFGESVALHITANSIIGTKSPGKDKVGSAGVPAG